MYLNDVQYDCNTCWTNIRFWKLAPLLPAIVRLSWNEYFIQAGRRLYSKVFSSWIFLYKSLVSDYIRCNKCFLWWLYYITVVSVLSDFSRPTVDINTLQWCIWRYSTFALPKLYKSYRLSASSVPIWIQIKISRRNKSQNYFTVCLIMWLEKCNSEIALKIFTKTFCTFVTFSYRCGWFPWRLRIHTMRQKFSICKYNNE